jgi:hypothetical protein
MSSKLCSSWFFSSSPKRDAAVAFDVPVGEELQLARQQRAVVCRHVVLSGDGLHAHERIGGVLVERWGGVRVEPVEIGG